MHALLNVAVMAAHRGGDTLIRSLNKLDRVKVEMKGRNDFVSEIDRAAERAVIDTIHKHYPGHAILAEESGAQGDSEYRWVIDPLDGTTNYLHGFPVFAVSVALLCRGRIEHGAVYDPMRQETFTASRGTGAQLNGHRLRVSGCRSLDRALVGTGFPFRESSGPARPYFDMLEKAIASTAGVRRPGAAALDLCYVGAGRLDAFWEMGLSQWDIAAGALIIREAGGIISGLDGSEDFLDSGHVLTGTPKIYSALAKLFAPDIANFFA
ncbi:MAG TPA: inositol monophosphatase family protein [Woeseiaceae bacterium]|nr:inositol monophosphatase family protein [Woeseiaceae bacterium]